MQKAVHPSILAAFKMWLCRVILTSCSVIWRCRTLQAAIVISHFLQVWCILRTFYIWNIFFMRFNIIHNYLRTQFHPLQTKKCLNLVKGLPFEYFFLFSPYFFHLSLYRPFLKFWGEHQACPLPLYINPCTRFKKKVWIFILIHQMKHM